MLDDYETLLRFKTISADKANEGDMRECATFLRDFLIKHLEFQAELWETELWPVVYGSSKNPVCAPLSEPGVFAFGGRMCFLGSRGLEIESGA